jgi:hypothetical protein
MDGLTGNASDISQRQDTETQPEDDNDEPIEEDSGLSDAVDTSGDATKATTAKSIFRWSVQHIQHLVDVVQVLQPYAHPKNTKLSIKI